MTRWCDNCKNKETCKKYKEEMQSPMSKFFQGCLGGYEEDIIRDCGEENELSTS